MDQTGHCGSPTMRLLDWLQRFSLGLPFPNPVARVGATEQLLNPQRRPLRRPLPGVPLLSPCSGAARCYC
jgi:hypothetical protein